VLELADRFRFRPRWVAPLVLSLGLLGGAPWAGQPAGPEMPGWIARPAGPDDPIVARVGGVAIPLSLVARKLALEPPGTTPKEVLDRLIDQEVMAQEAVRLGLGADAEVRDAWKEAAVQRLLTEVFEPTARLADLPEELLHQSFEQNRAFFNNPDLISICHVLLPIPKKLHAPESTWQARRVEAAKLQAELVRGQPRTREDFVNQAEALRPLAKDLRIEDVGPVARMSPLVQEFIDATFALTQDGAISPPVRTEYGWHILFRYGFREHRTTTFEQARPEVVQKVWPEWRSHRFEQWADELKEHYEVVRETAASSGPIYAPPAPGR
jgi:hypothetical protein